MTIVVHQSPLHEMCLKRHFQLLMLMGLLIKIKIMHHSVDPMSAVVIIMTQHSSVKQGSLLGKHGIKSWFHLGTLPATIALMV